MDVIAGLSRALDITEGHPTGHAARSCVIGMRLAHACGLDEAALSDLFHALLLKDVGCSIPPPGSISSSAAATTRPNAPSG